MTKLHGLRHYLTMKKLTSILLGLITIVTLTSIMSACIPKASPAQYTLVYLASDGGRVKGEQIQIVDKGEDAETVTAVAKEGYVFVGWSDGVSTAERTDKNVQDDIEVVANFSIMT